jgi:ArsR family transcriptional regulator, cadmium/lead-responsive transcriptional repressor
MLLGFGVVLTLRAVLGLGTVIPVRCRILGQRRIPGGCSILDGFAAVGTVGVPNRRHCRRNYDRLMAMTSGAHDRDCRVDLTPAVSLFRSLGDPTRLAIVHELAKGERRVVDLTGHLGLAQSTVSAHLALMRESGVVECRALGRQSLYRLSRPELFTVLTAAESLLAAGGNDVELCPPTDASSGNAQLVRDVSSSISQVSSRNGQRASVASPRGAALADSAGNETSATDSNGLVRDSAIPAGVADVAAK